MATKKITAAAISKNVIAKEMKLEEGYACLTESVNVLTAALKVDHETFAAAEKVVNDNLKAYNAMLTKAEYTKLAAAEDVLEAALLQRDITQMKKKTVKDKESKKVTGYELEEKYVMINLPKLNEYCVKNASGSIYADSENAEDLVAAAAKMFSGFLNKNIQSKKAKEKKELVYESKREGLDKVNFTSMPVLKRLVQNCLVAIAGSIGEDNTPVYELEENDFFVLQMTITDKVASYNENGEKTYRLRATTEKVLWEKLTDMMSKCANGYEYELEAVTIKRK